MTMTDNTVATYACTGFIWKLVEKLGSEEMEHVKTPCSNRMSEVDMVLLLKSKRVSEDGGYEALQHQLGHLPTPKDVLDHALCTECAERINSSRIDKGGKPIEYAKMSPALKMARLIKKRAKIRGDRKVERQAEREQVRQNRLPDPDAKTYACGVKLACDGSQEFVMNDLKGPFYDDMVEMLGKDGVTVKSAFDNLHCPDCAQSGQVAWPRLGFGNLTVRLAYQHRDKYGVSEKPVEGETYRCTQCDQVKSAKYVRCKRRTEVQNSLGLGKFDYPEEHQLIETAVCVRCHSDKEDGTMNWISYELENLEKAKVRQAEYLAEREQKDRQDFWSHTFGSPEAGADDRDEMRSKKKADKKRIARRKAERRERDKKIRASMQQPKGAKPNKHGKK